MRNDELAKYWMVGGGAGQVLMGLLGSMDTSVVGRSSQALLSMNMMHANVHALGGLVSIAIGLFLAGHSRAVATLAYGSLFVVGLVLNLASPDLWGRMDVPANGGVHVMHATIALITLTVGYLAYADTTSLRARALGRA